MNERREARRRVKAAFRALFLEIDTASGVDVQRAADTVTYRYLPAKGDLAKARKMAREAMKIAEAHFKADSR
jgi:aspartate aminotransferase-like enzyme